MPYGAYTTAGLQWLDRYPSHWAKRRFKQVLRAVDMRSTSGEEELLTVSSTHGVVPRSSQAVTMFKAASYVGHKLASPGDLVINSLWAWRRGLGVSRHFGIVSTAYGVYRPLVPGIVDPQFLHFYVRSEPYNWELRERSRGIWISRLQLTDDRFLASPFVAPPIEEQRAIVTYLANAHRRINTAVASKRRLVALLGEYGSNVAQEILSGREGLQATPLVESGSPSLGRVPAGWTLATVGAMVREIQTGPFGTQLHANEYVTGGVPVVNPKHIVSGKIVPEQTVTVTEERAGTLAWHRLRAGDVIAARRGELGRCAVVAEADAGAICGTGSVVIRVDRYRITPEYFQLLFSSRQTRSQLEEASRGSTMPNLNEGMIARVRLAVPPLEIQSAIVKAVKAEIARQDARVAVVRREIALLEEFKARLTADVVTGRVDVRAVASDLPRLDLSDGFAEAEAAPDLDEDDDVAEDGMEDQ